MTAAAQDDHAEEGPSLAGASPEVLLGLLGQVAADRSAADARLLRVVHHLTATTMRSLLTDKGYTTIEELSATARGRLRAEAKRVTVAELRVRLGIGEREARALTGIASTEPWQHCDYWAVLEREATRLEGEDVQAERERRRAAYQARRSHLSIHDNGTARMSITGPLTTMCAIHARVEHAARALRKGGDSRTLDQLRSDIPAGLLLYGQLTLPHPSTEDDLTVDDLHDIARITTPQPRINLQIVVPWDVLADRAAGVPEHGGTSCGSGRVGRGPHPPSRGIVAHVLGRHSAFITPGHARELALIPGTTLSRLLVDPADGRIVERTVNRYRPDADMRRQIIAADVHSRAPGSRVPATACELDHVTPYGAPGGVTGEHNLAAVNVRSHQFKTARAWHATINHRRDLTWTTLLAQATTTRVHDYRAYLDRRAPVDPTQTGLPDSERDDLADRHQRRGQAHPRGGSRHTGQPT